MTFEERALAYAKAVVSGEQPACKYVKQACQRQLNDLADPPAGYSYQPRYCQRVCKFIQLCPHIKGPLAKEGRNIELEDWQVFILMTVPCFDAATTAQIADIRCTSQIEPLSNSQSADGTVIQIPIPNVRIRLVIAPANVTNI